MINTFDEIHLLLSDSYLNPLMILISINIPPKQQKNKPYRIQKASHDLHINDLQFKHVRSLRFQHTDDVKSKRSVATKNNLCKLKFLNQL